MILIHLKIQPGVETVQPWQRVLISMQLPRVPAVIDHIADAILSALFHGMVLTFLLRQPVHHRH